MIKLTRLNGQEFLLNPDHLISIESTPDTMVRLTNDEKFTVKESIEDITNAYIDFKKRIHLA